MGIFITHKKSRIILSSKHPRLIINSSTRQARGVCVLQSTYCPERKSAERFGLPSQFSLLCEIHEAAAAVLDARVVAVINKYPDLLEYIHVSDQYSGPKQVPRAGRGTQTGTAGRTRDPNRCRGRDAGHKQVPRARRGTQTGTAGGTGGPNRYRGAPRLTPGVISDLRHPRSSVYLFFLSVAGIISLNCV